MMTPQQIRLNQNPILTNLLLGMGQGTMIAKALFPALPQALTSAMVVKSGNSHLKRYNLRRAPGAATKRIDIKYEGQVYTVDQYSVDVPIPREMIRESDAMRRMNIGSNLDISRIAMNTASAVLALDYELECASRASDPTNYAPGHVQALAGATKWSASTGTPVTDIRAAGEMIRRKTGKRPNTLVLSPDAKWALEYNPEVRSSLPNLTQLGPATMDQLKTILGVDQIIEGDAIWIDGNDVATDVWANCAVLAYVPQFRGASDISLAEPAYGWTSVLEGHPFAEVPEYDRETKSWIYGATYERRANLAYAGAGFLFSNVR